MDLMIVRVCVCVVNAICGNLEGVGGNLEGVGGDNNGAHLDRTRLFVSVSQVLTYSTHACTTFPCMVHYMHPL